jgi:hypothetical protein
LGYKEGVLEAMKSLLQHEDLFAAMVMGRVVIGIGLMLLALHIFPRRSGDDRKRDGVARGAGGDYRSADTVPADCRGNHLGCAFERRRGAGGDVVGRRPSGLADGGAGAGAGRECRQRPQSIDRDRVNPGIWRAGACPSAIS